MTADAFVPAFKHPPVYSDWFDLASQAPWEPGVYEVTGPFVGSSLYSYWDGAAFNYIACASPDYAFQQRACPGGGSNVTRWRGIVPPSRLPRFVSETWDEAMARVPALSAFRDKPVASNLAEVCLLLDCMPGYDFHQVMTLFSHGAVILYRRRDPA